MRRGNSSSRLIFPFQKSSNLHWYTQFIARIFYFSLFRYYVYPNNSVIANKLTSEQFRRICRNLDNDINKPHIWRTMIKASFLIYAVTLFMLVLGLSFVWPQSSNAGDALYGFSILILALTATIGLVVSCWYSKSILLKRTRAAVKCINRQFTEFEFGLVLSPGRGLWNSTFGIRLAKIQQDQSVITSFRNSDSDSSIALI